MTDKQVWDSNGDPLSSEDFSEDARAAYIKPAANRPATTTIRSSSLTKTTRSSSPTKTSRIGATVTSAKAQVSDPPKKNKPKKEKPKTEKTEKKKGKKTTKTKKKRPQKEQPNKKKEKKPAKSKETPTTSPHQAEIPEYFEADWENMEKAAQTTDVPFR